MNFISTGKALRVGLLILFIAISGCDVQSSGLGLTDSHAIPDAGPSRSRCSTFRGRSWAQPASCAEDDMQVDIDTGNSAAEDAEVAPPDDGALHEAVDAGDEGPTAAVPGDAAAARPTVDAGRSEQGRPSSRPEMPDASDAQQVTEGLVVEYANRTGVDDSVEIAPRLRIANRGEPVGVPLEDLELRYFFTNEQSAQCPSRCTIVIYWTGLQPSGTAISAERRYVVVDAPKAYMRVTFPAHSHRLSQGESVELQQSFRVDSFLPFIESNDYSFTPNQPTYLPSMQVALYRQGHLVWGTAPY
jgi:hypothetical protein